MKKTHPTLQEPFLNALRKERVPVSIFLVNGIKLVGWIESFDQYVVLLKNNSIGQLIYKHAISTIVPTRRVKLPRADAADQHDDVDEDADEDADEGEDEGDEEEY